MSFIADHPASTALAASAALAAVLAARKLIETVNSPIKHLPTPTGADWFWGHELITHESPFGEAHRNWLDSYGPTYRIKGAMFHPDILVTADPGALSHIFNKEVYSYTKSPIILPIIERLMGRSVLWAEGDVHKRQRAQLSRFFTTQATRDMFEMIQVCARTASERLHDHVAGTTDGDSKRGGKVDILHWTACVTLDIIGRFAFNFDFESGESEAARAIQHAWKQQVDLGFQRAALIGLAVIRAFPFIVDLPVKAIQAQGEVKTTVRETAQSIIDRKVDDEKQKDILSTLARLSEKGELSAPKDELLDHVSTLVLVGHETTAGTINFALHELARNQEYQTRLREEINALGREPTYEDLMSGMPWLDAVMKETFRHRPISSQTERVALKDDILRLRTPVYNDRGHKITEVPIKAGQVILIPSIALTHMKTVWGEDANEFRPERWLDPTRLPPASQTSGGWNGLFIFSEGPRNCIGFRLAILEFKTILTTYIRNFEFHDTGATVHARFSTTLQPYVVGEEAKGSQLPLIVRPIDH